MPYEASGLWTESFSNGAAYGDLDNDGDLDVVVNNLNMESFVYRNNSEKRSESNYLKLVLKGTGQNTYAVGAKVAVLNANILIENQPVRGFQSSMDPRIHIGLPTADPRHQTSSSTALCLQEPSPHDRRQLPRS